jgi:hypothetical protein
MTVSKLSLVLQREILDSLIANTVSDIETATGKLPGKSFKNVTIAIKVTSANATRILTDKNQTGIFGKEGL